MLVKIAIIVFIVALIVSIVYTLFKLMIGLLLFNKFKDKIDDLEFTVKTENEEIKDEKL